MVSELNCDEILTLAERESGAYGLADEVRSMRAKAEIEAMFAQYSARFGLD